ncbi:immunity protein 32 [Bradyrhizobium sp. BRP14]|nr:immunity protein 32 [Bradyrhizobium sp. BRP14]
MILTVELENAEHPEVAVCFDLEGLDLLISKLEALRKARDHSHLMTPSWAGDSLTEEKQGGERYELVNHLRLVRVC